MPQSDDLKILQTKPSLTHCSFEIEDGCAIHESEHYPEGCRVFKCPYLDGEDMHRPDTFQQILEDLDGNIGNLIPVVPRSVPPMKAIELIIKTRSVLAAFVLESKWVRAVMPLDREADGSWYPTEQLLAPWADLCAKYGVSLVGADAINGDSLRQSV